MPGESVPVFTVESLQTPEGLADLNRILQVFSDNVAGDTDTVRVYQGFGKPESAIKAGIGSIFQRLDGGAGTTLYVKESGTGATGWVAQVDTTLSGASAGGGLTGTYPDPTLAANSVDSAAYVDGSIDTLHLNTVNGTYSVSANTHVAITGGQYCFYPQVHAGVAEAQGRGIVISVIGNITWTSAETRCSLTRTSQVAHASFRYVTGSGRDYWVFAVVDKVTGKVIMVTAAPDHVSYGNGGNPILLPHPFYDIDETKQDIIILGKDSIQQLQSRVEGGKPINHYLHDDFNVDLSKSVIYQPLHIGSFSDKQKKNPILLNSLPSNIQVREIQELSNADKIGRKQERIDDGIAQAQTKEVKRQDFMIKHNFNEADMLFLQESQKGI